jgi:hypothetical protein
MASAAPSERMRRSRSGSARLALVNGNLGVLSTALVALFAMSLLMRWVFRRPKRRVVVPADAVPGLLVLVRSGLRREDGMALRAHLGDAGIRSSMSTRRDRLVDVSVFTADAERARAILPPGASGPSER